MLLIHVRLKVNLPSVRHCHVSPEYNLIIAQNMLVFTTLVGNIDDLFITLMTIKDDLLFFLGGFFNIWD